MNILNVRWDDRGNLIVRKCPHRIYRRLNDAAGSLLLANDHSVFDGAVWRAVGLLATLPGLRDEASREPVNIPDYFHPEIPGMISGRSNLPTIGGSRAA